MKADEEVTEAVGRVDMGVPIQEAPHGGKAGVRYFRLTGWRKTVFSFSGAVLRESPR